MSNFDLIDQMILLDDALQLAGSKRRLSMCLNMDRCNLTRWFRGDAVMREPSREKVEMYIELNSSELDKERRKYFVENI